MTIFNKNPKRQYIKHLGTILKLQNFQLMTLSRRAVRYKKRLNRK